MMYPGRYYTIFPTKWGYFAFIGTEKYLLQTCLPTSNKLRLEGLIRKNRPDAKREKQFLTDLQQRICAYFDGEAIDFTDTEVFLDDRSNFARVVLSNCRTLVYGNTISYGRLAAISGSAHTCRAAGNILAANPAPLIIPCHRVIRSDGKGGGFSPAGGGSLKAKMLALEKGAGPLCG